MKDFLKSLSDRIDRRIQASPILAFDSNQILEHITDHVETMFGIDYGLGSQLNEGLNMILPEIWNALGTQEASFEALRIWTEELLELSKYRHLKELIQYARETSTVSIKRNQLRIDFEFSTRDIPRQYTQTYTRHLQGVVHQYSANINRSKNIERLLSGVNEFGPMTSKRRSAIELIAQEARESIEKSFHFSGSGNTHLGDFTISSYRAVYTELVKLALYHRYVSTSNSRPQGAVHFGIHDFTVQLSNLLGLSLGEVQAVLEVFILVPSRATPSDRVELKALVLLEEDNEVILMPNRLMRIDGWIALLRHTARENPQAWNYLGKNVSVALTSHIASQFRSAGYAVLEEEQVWDNNQLITDIDLVAAKPQPSHVDVFICEVKANIPPTTARDHLTALRKTSIAKAFGQLERIQVFLEGPHGPSWLSSRLQKLGVTCDTKKTVINYFVIPSFNAGLFFEDMRYPVLNYRDLEVFLQAGSDSTAVSNWWHRKRRPELDALYDIETTSVLLDDVKVVFPLVVNSERMLD